VPSTVLVVVLVVVVVVELLEPVVVEVVEGSVVLVELRVTEVDVGSRRLTGSRRTGTPDRSSDRRRTPAGPRTAR
jgi:hypothetical protein